MDQHTQEVQAVVPETTVIKQQGNSLAIPGAIVFGFGLIAVAIFFSGGKNVAVQPNTDTTNTETEEMATIKGPVRPVDENDHIRGNPNAPIMIIEYSDFDCPFCKNFHETMNQVMTKYGTNGQVAWVYRHYPIPQLHPSAPRIALASECVAKLGGNEAFWKFADLVFGERGTNEQTNTSRLNEFAVSSGVSGTAFDSCVEDEQTKAQVDEDVADGINAGAEGTPYSLVLVGGQQGTINGARPYEYVSNVIDTLIAQMEGKKTE